MSQNEAKRKEHDAVDADKPVSLSPLSPEQALKGLLRVKPLAPPKREKPTEKPGSQE